jgi:anti-sigma B factor antagonist
LEPLLKSETEILDDGTRVVSIDGELDLYTGPQFERALFGALDGAADVVVDLAECSFIDSTALGILVAANRRLGGSGLAVVTDDRNIRKAFEVTGLGNVLAIHPTRAAALNGGVRV